MGHRPNWQLYSFNAVAYESVMLGVVEILYNTPRDNTDGMEAGLPKQTGLHFCFSRDGNTFAPRVEADIAPEGWGSGKWDTGYLSATGDICVIRDERLWFYYSASGFIAARSIRSRCRRPSAASLAATSPAAGLRTTG